jgi:hypothetical protein
MPLIPFDFIALKQYQPWRTRYFEVNSGTLGRQGHPKILCPAAAQVLHNFLTGEDEAQDRRSST